MSHVTRNVFAVLTAASLLFAGCTQATGPATPGEGTGDLPGDSDPAAGDPAGGDTVAFGTMVGSGKLTDQYARMNVEAEGHNYLVSNNAWGYTGYDDTTHRQVLSFLGTSFEIVEQDESLPVGSTAASSPLVYTGRSWGSSSSSSPLPVQVSAISSIPTKFSTNSKSITGAFQSQIELWFHTTSATTDRLRRPSRSA